MTEDLGACSVTKLYAHYSDNQNYIITLIKQITMLLKLKRQCSMCKFAGLTLWCWYTFKMQLTRFCGLFPLAKSASNTDMHGFCCCLYTDIDSDRSFVHALISNCSAHNL